jgi:hypothetical protein
LAALAKLTVGAVACEPVLAGVLGAGASGRESSEAICLAVTVTALGTG